MIFERIKQYPLRKATTILAGIRRFPVSKPFALLPVGAVYLNITGVNPGTELEYGTWSQIAQGQMLVGFKTADPDFGVVEGTGGTKTHTHAGHNNHVVTQPNNHIVTQPDAHTIVAGIRGTSAGDVVTTGAHAGTAVDAHSGTNVDAHSGHDTPSHLNPFFTIFIWKRTS